MAAVAMQRVAPVTDEGIQPGMQPGIQPGIHAHVCWICQQHFSCANEKCTRRNGRFPMCMTCVRHFLDALAAV